MRKTSVIEEQVWLSCAPGKRQLESVLFVRLHVKTGDIIERKKIYFQKAK